MGTTKVQCCSGSSTTEQGLLPAIFDHIRRCPARSDYIEMCFETGDGTWTWCIPQSSEQSECGCGDGALAITVGPYGAQARYLQDGGLGFSLPSAEAMALILGGSQTYVARKLVERGW